MEFSKLLSTCISLGLEAAEVIRSVQRDRESKGGDSLKAELKDNQDPTTWLTIADTQAQQVIVDGLHSLHPTVQIVAEEEFGEKKTTKSTVKNYQIPEDIVKKIESIESLKEFNDKDFCVFIDPVDGTREFVEGRLTACQVLIGISRNGVPIAGVVILPFWSDLEPISSSSATGHLIYGVVGAGVFGIPQTVTTSHLKRPNPILATSALSSNSTLSAAKDVIHESIPTCTDLPVGACGNKILQMLLGKADFALFNLGTSLWDTCATGALITAAGGVMTTLIGTPIQHHLFSTTKNVFGVWVSMIQRYNDVNDNTITVTHGEVSEKLGNEKEVGIHLLRKNCGYHDPDNRPPALDILRGCAGDMLTASFLSKKLNNSSITHYCVPNDEAVRYRQSYACRYYFYSENEDGSGYTLLKTAFYKWIVLNELPAAIHKAKHQPYKLARDARSCLVESDFLASPCCTEYSSTSGVKVALAYYTERFYCEQSPVDSRFYVMLKDFNQTEGWVQAPYFSPNQMSKSLESLAYFHSYFWCSREVPLIEEFRSKVWSRGGYLEPSKQPAGQKDEIIKMWDEVMIRFGTEIGTLADDIPIEKLKQIGTRLTSIADYCSSQIHGIKCDGTPADDLHDMAFTKYKTLVHGDAKAANFFFSTPEDEPEKLSLGLIDFQWVGVGTPAHDIAYCITASLSENEKNHPTTLDPLVSEYYSFFCSALKKYGIDDPPFSVEELQHQCRIAVLDISRVVVTSMFSTLTPEMLKQRFNKQSFNSYNKSSDCLIWMVKQIHTSLESLGC